MSNLFVAVEAVTYARQVIPPNTSDNKKFLSTISFDDLSIPKETRLKALEAHANHGLKQQNLHGLRANKFNPQVGDRSIKRCQQYGEACISRALGNCLEYSCVIAKFLKNKKVQFDLVTFEGGDHVFVAIGQPSPDGGRYPANFAAWDAEAAIADAWADIGCLASEFPNKWRARMTNWDNTHMQLAQVGGGFISATNAYWYDAVDNGKLSFTQSA
jgi:hypothetical protein